MFLKTVRIREIDRYQGAGTFREEPQKSLMFTVDPCQVGNYVMISTLRTKQPYRGRSSLQARLACGGVSRKCQSNLYINETPNKNTVTQIGELCKNYV